MYTPREDSFFLAKEIEKYLAKLPKKTKNVMKILDMGSGSGIQAETCIKSGVQKRNILTSDIDEESTIYLKKKGFKAIHANLFSHIKGKFNLILFNPPYLPEHPKEKALDTTGGRKGYETILLFLKQAKNHLKKQGRILLLFINLSKPRIIKREAKKHYHLKEKARKKLFFEELYVVELQLP